MSVARPYLKGVAPALCTVVAVIIEAIVVGGYDPIELATALTGLSCALIAFLVPNHPGGPMTETPLHPPEEPEPAAPEPDEPEPQTPDPEHTDPGTDVPGEQPEEDDER